MTGALVIGSRERTQPAPPHRIWESLHDPHLAGAREWLILESDEIEPVVLGGEVPSWLQWSSLWPSRPDDLVRFDIADDGASGSRLRWTLTTTGEPPDASKTGFLCTRLNRLINADLRYSYGQ